MQCFILQNVDIMKINKCRYSKLFVLTHYVASIHHLWLLI